MPNGSGLVLSVVSHGQRGLLLGLLDDLQSHVKISFRIIVTENIPEEPDLPIARYSYPIVVIKNSHPTGFGANHNAALQRAGSGLFCVINPDIRLRADPFPALLAMVSDPRIGVVTPAVTDPAHAPEDHARSFPSVFTLVGKLLGYRPKSALPEGKRVYHPDWIAGMFMLFRTETIRSVDGFDERYYLYYEDVDLCARLRDLGLDVAVCTDVSVIHAARRESRRNARFASWHVRSAIRFLASRPRIALGFKSRHREAESN